MLHVVTGPPCGGKTTFVSEHREPDDLVLDLDQLAHALGYPEQQVRWGGCPHIAVLAARKARTQLLRSILQGELRGTAWVIDTNPDRSMRAQYERAGAQFHQVDPGEDVCRVRAADRDPSTLEGIENWYRGQPPLRKPGRPAAALSAFDG